MLSYVTEPTDALDPEVQKADPQGHPAPVGGPIVEQSGK